MIAKYYTFGILFSKQKYLTVTKISTLPRHFSYSSIYGSLFCTILPLISSNHLLPSSTILNVLISTIDFIIILSCFSIHNHLLLLLALTQKAMRTGWLASAAMFQLQTKEPYDLIYFIEIVSCYEHESISICMEQKDKRFIFTLQWWRYLL